MSASSNLVFSDVYARLIVLRGIQPNLSTTGSLEAFLRKILSTASVLRWHDPQTAILQFPSANSAAQALTQLEGASRLSETFRKMHEGSSPLGALPTSHLGGGGGAFTSSGDASVSSSRPVTDTAVANRLIKGALGAQRNKLGPAARDDPAATGSAYLRSSAAPLPRAGGVHDSLSTWRNEGGEGSSSSSARGRGESLWRSVDSGAASSGVPPPSSDAKRPISSFAGSGNEPRRGGGGGEVNRGGGASAMGKSSRTEGVWERGKIVSSLSPNSAPFVVSGGQKSAVTATPSGSSILGEALSPISESTDKSATVSAALVKAAAAAAKQQRLKEKQQPLSAQDLLQATSALAISHESQHGQTWAEWADEDDNEEVKKGGINAPKVPTQGPPLPSAPLNPLPRKPLKLSAAAIASASFVPPSTWLEKVNVAEAGFVPSWLQTAPSSPGFPPINRS